MFPEMVNKKVYTENKIEIGTIVDIQPNDLGSFIVKIQTRFSEYPNIELPVTSLRKSEENGDTIYIIPNSLVPIKLKMLIEKEQEEAQIEEETKVELQAPEVPPLEKFQKKREEEVKEEKKEEEIEKEEEKEEVKEETVEEVAPEIPPQEEEQEKPKKKGFLQKLIEFIKKLFGKA